MIKKVRENMGPEPKPKEKTGEEQFQETMEDIAKGCLFKLLQSLVLTVLMAALAYYSGLADWYLMTYYP